MTDKRLRTLKKAAAETGASVAFLYRLVRQGKLTGYRIQSALYISLAEMESLATPNQKKHA